MIDERTLAAAKPADHPRVAGGRVGVLLVNLGTPNAPTPAAVKVYLREFLSDRWIVDLPRALWLPLLHGVILNVRPAKTAEAYRSIWLEEPAESPLLRHTRAQADALRARLGGDGVMVDFAMRYGDPSIASRVAAMKEAGCERLLVVPLYPQYSATTTASVHDATFDAVKALRWQPAIRLAPAFHDHPAYIDALAAVTRRRLAALDWSPERIVISFHGIPQRYFDAGDPYHCHCQKTARLLRERMGWTREFAPTAFQSKFGAEKWLEPATTDVIDGLAADGARRLAVITPAFVADCIETLEEIGIAAREQFEEAGGMDFDAIPCLNDAPEAVDLLEAIARTELSGWIAEAPAAPAYVNAR
ncbi:MAG: ferrochelatase [Parvularculaceae bacterium]